jgi:hypothetical protein
MDKTHKRDKNSILKNYLKTTLLVVVVMLIVLILSNQISNKNALAAESAKEATTTFVMKNVCGFEGKSPCTVGSIGPNRGTIFFVDYFNEYSSFNYMEAAPVNWSKVGATVDPSAIWCDKQDSIIQQNLTNWENRAVGIGKSNTQIMLKACLASASNLIKEYNDSKRSKSSDWFLPSMGEILLLATNIQGLGSFSSGEYWSSSEYNKTGGWAESFGRGYQGASTKSYELLVRPIRNFQ